MSGNFPPLGLKKTLRIWEPPGKVDDWGDVEDQANDDADNTFARIVGVCGWLRQSIHRKSQVYEYPTDLGHTGKNIAARRDKRTHKVDKTEPGTLIIDTLHKAHTGINYTSRKAVRVRFDGNTPSWDDRVVYSMRSE